MDGLKQRIIGALVLVSLAVIFVPMMFDEPHSERESTTIKIPEEPPFPEVDAPEPELSDAPAYRLEESDAAGEPDSTPQPSNDQPTPDADMAGTEPQPVANAVEEPQNPPEPAPSEEPSSSATTGSADPATETDSAEYTRSLEGAWVVQLGSFGSGDNARRLRDKVRDKGYNSHLQQVTRGDTELTRVFSGPFAEKAEAERAKQALDKAFGLNSLVTSGDK
ncbi:MULTISPECIES: SPOR domain-containing protein [Marinobacter]|uniref:SPOR domain-containing protein n=1 Tax=Marinobacter TaxID=2742 RepID=UPI000948A886|nr:MULTISPECIES: SPOR domain-containing protein [Marinobacter]MBS8232936.1 sporulation protein [Marinobacter salarius]MCZ4286227.1 SPOR domain-containing protein [Marinobacter salarius]OLF84249.1 sporulation protein [Marinobacter sp. C18]